MGRRSRSDKSPECVVVKTVFIAAMIALSLSPAGCKRSDHGTQAERTHAQDASRHEGEDYLNSTGLRMIWVPPGQFTMGRTRCPGEYGATPELLELERPRVVKVDKGFWILATEVTVEQYDRILGTAATGGRGAVDEATNTLPVTNVTWRDAVRFCETLSRAEGRTYRLPTTKEWEYACRGGPYAVEDDCDTPKDVSTAAWYGDNSTGRLHRVGTLAPNALGLYDMQSNAWEWCATIVPPELVVSTPYGRKKCAFIRGGSYRNAARSCECGSTYASFPVDRSDPGCGFRVIAMAGPSRGGVGRD